MISLPRTASTSQHDPAVVEQQHRAGRHVAGQLLVVEARRLPRRPARASASSTKVWPLLSVTLPSCEFADTDLGTLQVDHDRDLAADGLRRVAHQLCALQVIGRGAVREIQAHDVDAGGDHPRQDIETAACGAKRGHDLGRSLHERSLGSSVRNRLGVRRCFENLDRGQRLAFEKFEKGAAAVEM